MGMICDKESKQRWKDAAKADRYEIFDMPRQTRQSYLYLPPNGACKRTHRDDQARCTGIFNLSIVNDNESAPEEQQQNDEPAPEEQEQQE